MLTEISVEHGQAPKIFRVDLVGTTHKYRARVSLNIGLVQNPYFCFSSLRRPHGRPPTHLTHSLSHPQGFNTTPSLYSLGTIDSAFAKLPTTIFLHLLLFRVFQFPTFFCKPCPPPPLSCQSLRLPSSTPTLPLLSSVAHVPPWSSPSLPNPSHLSPSHLPPKPFQQMQTMSAMVVSWPISRKSAPSTC